MQPALAPASGLDALVTTFASAFAEDPLDRWRRPHEDAAAIRARYRSILGQYVDPGMVWAIDHCRGGVAWVSPAEVARFLHQLAVAPPPSRRATRRTSRCTSRWAFARSTRTSHPSVARSSS